MEKRSKGDWACRARRYLVGAECRENGESRFLLAPGTDWPWHCCGQSLRPTSSYWGGD